MLKVAGSIPGRGCTNLYCARGAQGVLRMREGVTASQLVLRCVIPLSIAGCGRLQLVVAHWATSVAFFK